MRCVDLDAADYLPRPPDRHDYGIGIVGCGGIANGAHLPAYRTCGYRVVACCDIRPDAAASTAQKFGIPLWTTDLDELLSDPDVQIVDLAVHATQRRPLVERIAAAGKHILSQKPFAMTLADAQRMVEVCEAAGVTLMVNQQARWAPQHRAVKVLLDRGIIGHLYSVLHLNRGCQDIAGSWYAALENFNIIDHGIHYIDLTRCFTGLTPIRVKATTTMVPGQHAISPMIYSITCEYDTPVMATLHFNNIIRASGLHGYTWYLDGTEGSIMATHTTIELCFKESPRERQVIHVQGSWFPDAFGGSMGELMQALTEGRAPQTSGRDNLQSVKIAYAAVESSQTGKAVDVS